jgi:colicin import membrane protein
MSEWSALRRAMIIIAAACCFSGSLQAQQSAQALANKFAGEAERAQAQKKKTAHTNKRTQPTAAAKVRAKAARAAELAHYIAEVRKAEEADMLARARREADNMREEERARLIQEAEKARAQAEAQATGLASTPVALPAPAVEKTTEQSPEGKPGVAAQARPPATTPGDAQSAKQERLATWRTEEAQKLLAKLRRASRIRDARLAAVGRREETARQEITNVATARNETQTTPVVRATGDSPVPPPQSEPVAAIDAGEPAHPGAQPQSRSSATLSPSVIAAAPAASSRSAALGPTDEDEVTEPASEPPRATAGLREPRVTVLLVMAPGNRGMRRHNKSADPVLCVTYGCYVSAGSAWPARFMPGHRALGILNTWGARAGACRDSLECVFRAIEVVELPGYLQPVDLRLLRHDRRRPQMITSDSACTVERARLLCTRGIYAEDYAMWIVPESIAAAAGPEALQRAAAEGLRRPQVAGLSPQP